MNDLICKCGHAVGDHNWRHGCVFYSPGRDEVCECTVKPCDFDALHRAIVDAAMRETELEGMTHLIGDAQQSQAREARRAAVRALKDATQ